MVRREEGECREEEQGFFKGEGIGRKWEAMEASGGKAKERG